MSVKVVVQFKALENRQEDFQVLMRSVSKDLPGVAGCRGVEVLQDREDACRFTLVETWDSVEIHKSHIDGLVADGTWAAISGHLAEDPVSGYFRSL
ncbi:putative quinol monooxygenase [Roseibium sp. Sym1]|uniref:putative quinol monooxygenase n=1 Tax=Roseibium sp. Sym1 TaxID=3016006 RepID=UPI0022B4C583|nr:antibiotic biosynthesis monooxygenase family protein [Roseibium sp. Sym1]